MLLNKKLAEGRLELINYDAGMSVEKYLEWLNDPEINRYLEVRFEKNTKEKIFQYIQDCNESQNRSLLAIRVKKDDIIIGNIKIDQINKNHKRAIIGILIGEKEYWGKGYATEAINLLCKYAFFDMGLEKLSAGCYSCNKASEHCFKKAGFVKVATLKNHWLCEGKWVDHIEMELSR